MTMQHAATIRIYLDRQCLQADKKWVAIFRNEIDNVVYSTLQPTPQAGAWWAQALAKQRLGIDRMLKLKLKKGAYRLNLWREAEAEPAITNSLEQLRKHCVVINDPDE